MLSLSKHEPVSLRRSMALLFGSEAVAQRRRL